MVWCIRWNFLTFYRTLYRALKNTFLKAHLRLPYHTYEKIYRSKIVGNWVYFKFLYNFFHVKTDIYGNMAKKLIFFECINQPVDRTPPLWIRTFSMLFVDIYSIYSMEKIFDWNYCLYWDVFSPNNDWTKLITSFAL